MDAVVATSRDAIVKGSSSFQAASRLFGRAVREDAWLLYAWCRHCDDEIDGQDHGRETRPLTRRERADRLERLRRSTRAALAGEPMTEPSFAAFQRVALRHGIDEAWPTALLNGFAMDVDPPRFDSIDDTLGYCWGVAGTVGVMMARVMGARGAAVMRRAQDLGLAFQLTNICRDIEEDARNGRLYLPASLLIEAGLPASTAAVLEPANRTAIHGVARRLLGVADAYYGSARVGLRDLPFRSAVAIGAARGVYREIGRRLVRQGPEALATRVSAPKPVLAWLLLRGALLAVFSRFERIQPTPPRPPLWSAI